ncbi:hypothetical protein CPLU01_03161 [Colletotrichum plurivorum]|uniref:Uncharacterized protein n=1 Tax=Colletotrichum plurivorum TaxID=2175906 RepID=A0A8H6KTD1_9PEZI|nr:hypothetical protein CPLU01_03161 [Colletotrichum plurivorum]
MGLSGFMRESAIALRIGEKKEGGRQGPGRVDDEVVVAMVPTTTSNTTTPPRELQCPPPHAHVHVHVHGSKTSKAADDVEGVMFRRLSEAREIGRLPCRFRLALGQEDFPCLLSTGRIQGLDILEGIHPYDPVGVGRPALRAYAARQRAVAASAAAILPFPSPAGEITK